MSEASDHWAAINKGATSLMVAHAAGLVTCLTLIKDYKDNPPLRGVGVFISMFGVGLITAVWAASLLLLVRGQYVELIEEKKAAYPIIVRMLILLANISGVIFVAAIGFAVYKFGKL
jgi:hypothetical protein